MEKEATTVEEVREILESFYNVYYPQKLNSIDLILEKYSGNYDRLLIQLRDKYKKEFSPIYEVHVQKKKSRVESKLNTPTSSASIQVADSSALSADDKYEMVEQKEDSGSPGRNRKHDKKHHAGVKHRHHNKGRGVGTSVDEDGMVGEKDPENSLDDRFESSGTESFVAEHRQEKLVEKKKADSTNLLSSFISKVAESVSDEPRSREMTDSKRRVLDTPLSSSSAVVDDSQNKLDPSFILSSCIITSSPRVILPVSFFVNNNL